MSLRINQNILSVKTHDILASTSSRLEKSIEKLSSGLRINRAADDAAGLAISEKLRRQIKGLARSILNAQDGISMLQSAEGALNESHSILQRMRELAIEASNDTLTSNDRLEIQKEINQLRDDLNRIANNTEFNTKKLLDGSQSAMLSSSSSSVRGVTWGASEVVGDFLVSLTLQNGGISEMQRSQIFTLKDQDPTTLAKGNTKLEDVAQFYDANGAFVLQSPQVLTVNGNSKSSSITLDRQMTLDQLAAALQNAVVTVGGLDIASSNVGLVTTSSTGIAGLGGYLEMTSGRIGETGQIAFSGDQGLVNALGMSVTREAKNNIIQVTASDGSTTTKVRTESNRVAGLISGIDLVYDSQAAQAAGTKGIESGLDLTAAVTFTLTASIAGVATNQAITLAIGTWTMNGIARSINDQITTGGTLTGMEADVVDGQIRISYDPADPNDPSTFDVTGAAASNPIGIQNKTDYQGFLIGAKNTGVEVFGLSKYNTTDGVAQQMTVDDGAGTNVTTTLYTTSNNAQLADMMTNVSIEDTLNNDFKTAGATSIAVRADVVNNTLALTSTRIGRLNNDGAAPSESLVILTGTTAILSDQFGLNDATAKGTGDKNFQIHVVNNQPQFQIGADQGQKMKIAIGNMGAEALGVDNLDMTTLKGAELAMSKINKAIDIVSAERSKMGAMQNRLEYAINNLRNTHSNLVAAESRIRDADIAEEMIEFTRDQIVSQSGTAMLAQANLVPQGVLQLLR